MSIETEEYQYNFDKLMDKLYEGYTRDTAHNVMTLLDDLIASYPELISEVVRTGVKVYASKST